MSMSCPFKNSPSPFLYGVGEGCFSRMGSKGVSSEKPSLTLQDHRSLFPPSLLPPMGLVVNVIKCL